MKSHITTSLGNAETNLENNKAIVLNDDDMNRIFG